VISAFVDPETTPLLYADSARLATRTAALARAKTSGRHAAEIIADLIVRHAGGKVGVLTDIGCGRGTSSIVLTQRVKPALLVAADAAGPLLDDARARFQRAGGEVPACWLRCDFHDLPLADASVDAAVAAFCLYHSPTPERAIAEIARVMRPGGVAILASKSAASYLELDELVQRVGLDLRATSRPSLYDAAPGALLPGLADRSLTVELIESERHTFTFAGPDHVAEYLATSPKYAIPADLQGNAKALAAHVRAHIGDRPVTTTSIVTFVLGRRTRAHM
jgi:SAM-dependent methyltransferase